MSKICTSCGAELSDDATFCGPCGKPVSLFTPPPQPEPTQTSGDMPSAELFGAPQQQPQQPQQQGGYGVPPQQPYGQPYGGQQYQQPYGQNMNAYNQSMNAYNQSQYMGLNENTFSPYSAQGEQPVSIGQWMITTILLAIPIVGIIYFIILAIGGPNTKKSLTNYARATLIWVLIAFVLSFIAVAVFGVSTSEILKAAGAK